MVSDIRINSVEPRDALRNPIELEASKLFQVGTNGIRSAANVLIEKILRVGAYLNFWTVSDNFVS